MLSQRRAAAQKNKEREGFIITALFVSDSWPRRLSDARDLCFYSRAFVIIVATAYQWNRIRPRIRERLYFERRLPDRNDRYDVNNAR